MEKKVKISVFIIFILSISLIVSIIQSNHSRKQYNEIIIMAFENGYLKGVLNYKLHKYNYFNKRMIESTKGFCNILNIDTSLVDKLNNDGK